MSDFQTLFDSLAARAKNDALAGTDIITLGELIAKLEQVPEHFHLFLPNGEYFNDLGSYRGFYSDLALQSGPIAVTVKIALIALRDAVGKTFTGYKGGDFEMSNRTLVWVSEYGDASEMGITGISLPADEQEVYIVATRMDLR